MKKSILLFAGALTLIACDPPSTDPAKSLKVLINTDTEQYIPYEPGHSSLRITTITHDSCEYIISSGFHEGTIIHKQNCKYCITRNKKS